MAGETMAKDKPPKPKLTKEEKAALARERKEAALLAKKEYERSIKKLKLTKEIDFTNQQMSEIRRRVFECAKTLNVPILKAEYMQKWNFFERTNEMKDFYISRLMNDIYHYEQQQRQTEHAHMTNITKIQDIFEDQIKHIHKIYLKERDELLKKRYTWANRLILTQKRRVEVMETMLYNVELDAKVEFRETEGKQHDEKQNLFVEFAEAFENIATRGDEIIDRIWKQRKAAFTAYKELTMQDRNQFAQDFQQDRKDQEEIHELTKKLEELYGEIDKLNETLSRADDKKMKLKEVIREKHEAIRLQNELNEELDKADIVAKDKLLFLSNISNDVLKGLKKIAQKTVTASNLWINCRKHMTENEKCFPAEAFGPPPLKLVDITTIKGLEERLCGMLDSREASARLNYIISGNGHLKECLNQQLRVKRQRLQQLRDNIVGMAYAAKATE